MKEKPNISHFMSLEPPFGSSAKTLKAIKHIFCGYLDGPKAVLY
jgi:hypothetical protein